MSNNIDIKEKIMYIEKISKINRNVYIFVGIRDEKIKCGKEILRTWSDKDFYQKLINQFDNFRIISECWK